MRQDSEILLERATVQVIEICNEIYTQINRSTIDTIDLTDSDLQLVKAFNTLVKLNQDNLNTLYPDRLKSKISLEYASLKIETSEFGGDDAWITDEILS